MTLTARIITGISALLIGGVALMAFLWHQSGLPWHAGDAQSWQGGDLEVVEGAALKGPDSVLVAFEPGSDRIIIKAPSMPLAAEDSTAITVSFDQLPPGVRAGVYWQSSESRRLQSTPLVETADGSHTARLRGHPGWKGTIAEIGLAFLGRNAGSFTVNGLELVPLSWSETLKAYSVGLTDLETWSQRSINSLVYPSSLMGATPTLVAAMLVFAAVIVVAILFLLLRKKTGFASVALGVFVTVWLLLDARWQWVLAQNLSQARELYAEIPHEQKNLFGQDAQLQQLASLLKTRMLPEEPKRVFIYDTGGRRSFNRLRLHYHLLPHNIHSLGKQPNPEFVKSGDYIVSIGPIPGVRYDSAERAMFVDGKGSIPSEQLHRSRIATVYRVISGNSGEASK